MGIRLPLKNWKIYQFLHTFAWNNIWMAVDPAWGDLSHELSKSSSQDWSALLIFPKAFLHMWIYKLCNIKPFKVDVGEEKEMYDKEMYDNRKEWWFLVSHFFLPIFSSFKKKVNDQLLKWRCIQADRNESIHRDKF